MSFKIYVSVSFAICSIVLAASAARFRSLSTHKTPRIPPHRSFLFDCRLFNGDENTIGRRLIKKIVLINITNIVLVKKYLIDCRESKAGSKVINTYNIRIAFKKLFTGMNNY
jgi:hypothetical protein